MMDSELLQKLQRSNSKKGSYDTYLRRGFFLIAIVFIPLIFWVTFAPIQGAVIASGKLVVGGDTKIIQHELGGTISEILVEDGEFVSTDDILVRLDSTILDANKQIVLKRLNEAKALSARLKAERDGRSSINWSTVFSRSEQIQKNKSIISDQNRLFDTRYKAKQGQKDQMEKQISQYNEQILGLIDQISSKERQGLLVSEELGGLLELQEVGLVSKNRVLSLQRQQEVITGEIAKFESEILRIRANISEIEIQILQVKRNSQESVLIDLRDVLSEINDLEQQLISADDKIQRVDLKAPVSGQVHNLQFSTVGGVVSPADIVLEIIPTDVNLEIESKILPDSIGQIYIGQKTTVRFLAFNQRTSPELTGFVSRISGDTLQDEASGISYYNVTIELKGNELAALGDVELVPGMPVESFMQTEERTVLDYLLQPLTDQLARSFKEQ